MVWHLKGGADTLESVDLLIENCHLTGLGLWLDIVNGIDNHKSEDFSNKPCLLVMNSHMPTIKNAKVHHCCPFG